MKFLSIFSFITSNLMGLCPSNTMNYIHYDIFTGDIYNDKTCLTIQVSENSIGRNIPFYRNVLGNSIGQL